MRRLIAGLDGVALHAAGLRFLHPVTGARVELASAPPPRLARLLSHLRRGAAVVDEHAAKALVLSRRPNCPGVSLVALRA